MSIPIDNGSGGSGDRDAAGERSLRALFAHAAPREAPPERDAAEIRAAVYAEWEAVTGRRAFLRRAGFAAAAAVLAAVAAFMIDTGPPAPLATVARVERLQGTVFVTAPGAASDAPLQGGDAVVQGSTLATGDGEVALRLASGGSLRLAPQTRVTLTAPRSAELRAGLVYFDSERSAPTDAFAIVTARGTLRDVGTQFMARVDPERLDVGVREGSVSLALGGDVLAVAAGERLRAAAGTSEVRREPIATFGADWAWVERLAPPFAIDGRRLDEFLQWVAAQTGRTLVFADTAAERIARETVLSGSIDLEPMPKLVAVLALTDLDHALDGGRLVIAARAATP